MVRSTNGGHATIIKIVRPWKSLRSEKPNRSGGTQTVGYTLRKIDPLASGQNIQVCNGPMTAPTVR
jgi:hypothetical protein